MRRSLGWYLGLGLTLSFAPTAWALEASPAEKHFEQGLKAFQGGAFQEAVSSWTDAARLYEREGRIPEQISALSDLSEAYSALGYYRQAGNSLQTALALAEKSRDTARVPSPLARPGHALIATGPPA